MEPKALCMMGKHSANGATTPAQDSFFFSNFFFFFAYHLALTEGILEKTNFLLVKISSLCWKYSCACQEYVLPQQVLSWELMFSQMKLLCLLSVSLSDDDQQVKGHVCSRNKWGWSSFLFWLLLFAFPGFKVVTQKIRHMWQLGPSFTACGCVLAGILFKSVGEKKNLRVTMRVADRSITSGLSQSYSYIQDDPSPNPPSAVLCRECRWILAVLTVLFIYAPAWEPGNLS